MATAGYVRGQVLVVSAAVGVISQIIGCPGPDASDSQTAFEVAVTKILVRCAMIAASVHIDLRQACLHKLELNALKYPVEKCVAEVCTINT